MFAASSRQKGRRRKKKRKGPLSTSSLHILPCNCLSRENIKPRPVLGMTFAMSNATLPMADRCGAHGGGTRVRLGGAYIHVPGPHGHRRPKTDKYHLFYFLPFCFLHCLYRLPVHKGQSPPAPADPSGFRVHDHETFVLASRSPAFPSRSTRPRSAFVKVP